MRGAEGQEAGPLTLDSITLTTRKTLVTSVVTCRGERSLRSERVGVLHDVTRGSVGSREATYRDHAPVLQTKSSVAHLQAQETKDGEQLRAEEERRRRVSPNVETC